MKTLLAYLTGDKEPSKLVNAIVALVFVLWGSGVGLIFAGWIHDFCHGKATTADLCQMLSQLFGLLN